MSFPIILFEGGTHGNFISRCLSLRTGQSTNKDLWQGGLGAHADISDSERVVQHYHPYETQEKNIFCYVKYTADDLYRILLYLYFAGGETGLDLLDNENFKSNIHSHSVHPMTKMLPEQLNQYEDSKRGQREFLKHLFAHMNKHYVEIQNKTLTTRNISHIINYKDIFDKSTFVWILDQLLWNLGLAGYQSIDAVYDNWAQKMKRFTNSEQRVKQAFDFWSKQLKFDIGDFKLAEQAYLDFMIERELGYEIQLYDQYPRDTLQMKPQRVQV